MKFLSKATMPVTLEIDDDGTIATKSYVDDKVANAGGGFPDWGEFFSEQDVIVHALTNDVPSGIYKMLFNGYPTTLWVHKYAWGQYSLVWLNAGNIRQVFYDHGTGDLKQIKLISEIESIQEQLSGLADLLEGI